MKSTKQWKVGRTMQKQVGIGKQDFAALRESQCFYIDKTDFIRQWWNYRDDVTACDSLNYLCRYLEHAYGKKVIILLDEYDTPMQEAYVYVWLPYGYLQSMVHHQLSCKKTIVSILGGYQFQSPDQSVITESFR